MGKKIKTSKDIPPEYELTQEEERDMDFISNHLIDLILSNPEKYLKKAPSANVR